MNLAHIVLLLGVTIAVVAIAGHLIAIVLILKHVVNRLTTILGAVEAVTTTAQPVESVIRDISADLDAGRKVIEDCVARLEDSRVPVGAAADEPARHAPDRHASDGELRGGAGGATTAPPAPAGAETDASEWPPSPPGRPTPSPGRRLWNR